MPRNPNTFCDVCTTPIYRRPGILEKSNGAAFCGRACYGISCQKTVLCLSCKVAIPAAKNTKTCSRACANKARTGMQYKQSGRPSKDLVSTRRILKARLVVSRGSVCEICGYSVPQLLRPHHIVYTSKGGTDELDNLLLVCPYLSRCHSLLPGSTAIGVVHRLESGWGLIALGGSTPSASAKKTPSSNSK
jgi:hypothetical protein